MENNNHTQQLADQVAQVANDVMSKERFSTLVRRDIVAAMSFLSYLLNDERFSSMVELMYQDYLTSLDNAAQSDQS